MRRKKRRNNKCFQCETTKKNIERVNFFLDVFIYIGALALLVIMASGLLDKGSYIGAAIVTAAFCMIVTRRDD